MGKIKKVATSKHDASVSPAISEFIQIASTAPLSQLPSHLASLPRRWPFPRGDLYHWIGPLNRFDEILESFNSRYGLKTGPQVKPFGISQLLEGSEGTDGDTLRRLGFGPEGDRELVESILDFSRLLLEKCGNRSLYNSSDRLNELLNTSSLSLLHQTLRVALCLAQRYRDRLRSGHFQHPPLTTHYNFSMDRIEKLAQQIPKPDSKKLLPTSPIKTSKGKEKVPRLTQRRSSSTVDPNDFRSLCGKGADLDTMDKNVGDVEPDREGWETWAQVTIMFSASDAKKHDVENATASSNQDDHNGISSPAPMRRQPSIGRSRLSRLSTSEDVNGHSEPPTIQEQRARPASDRFSPPISSILNSPLEVVLTSGLASVPTPMHYELLHKLRIAYGLVHSGTTRRQLLAIRLLAIANLAYVLPDGQFQQKIFGQDRESSQHQQLVRQLVSLLYAGSDRENQVPLFIQTHALEALGALTKQKSMIPDLASGLGVTANHGTLLYLVRKGLSDLVKDHDSTDNVVGDEWRDGLFSLLKLTLDASPHVARSSDAFASPALMTAYTEILQTHTEKAQRLYLKVLEFLEAFTHHIKDGLATLLNNKTFEAVADLLNYLVSSTLKLVQDGEGFPSAYRTPSIDYQIPYLHQQSIRAILSFINGLNGHQGGPADRVLRSLIDSHKLLDAFRLVVQNASTFGAHTWSEVVKAMNAFLHNEPTSYTVIAEAGLSKSFLQSITLKDTEMPSAQNGVPSEQSSPEASTAPGVASTHSSQSSETEPNLPSSTAEIVSSEFCRNPPGILPAAEAISSASQTFGAICLTAAGYELFKRSGALETFFDVFVSAPHVKVMNDPSLLAILGSTFDELVRHHPGMRSDVLSMVLVTLSRVGTLCRSMAQKIGAGVKLWVSDGANGLAVAGGNESLLHEMLPQAAADTLPAASTPFRLQLPNGKILISDPPNGASSISETVVPSDKDENGLTVADYMTPIVGFLMSFFENQSLCAGFIDAGGVKFTLDLATMPSLPLDFFRASAHIGSSHDIAQVIHMMAETKPHLVLPSLVNHALWTCQQLESFAQNQPHDMSCYFGALTRRQGETPEPMETEISDQVRQHGTKIAKALTSILFLTTLLTETFESPFYNTRNPQQSLFAQVNLADLYVQLCNKLGDISAACIREEISLQKNAPNSWLEATKPKGVEPDNDDIDLFLGLDRNQGLPSESAELPLGSAQAASSASNVEAETRPTVEDQSLTIDKRTPAFKNVVVLRYLLTQLPSSVTQFFSLLGRCLLTKRRLELYQKQNALMVAEAISKALIAQLDPRFLRSPERFQNRRQFLETRFAYLGVALVNLYHVILDTSPSADFKQSITSVVLCFRNIGGLQLLKDIGKEFFDELKSCEVSDDHSPSMATANSGLKVTLDIFEHLTSAKCVVESVQSGLLKNQDRMKPSYFVPAQFLLELRMEALPLARMIWESDYADQAFEAVIEKLVAILRHVLSGEYEEDAHKEGHEPPPRSTESLRKALPSPNPRDLETLVSQGFDEALAREALYRCNNHITNAEDYCKAYARDPSMQRNPIPEYELESKNPRGPGMLRNNDQAESSSSDQVTQTSSTNAEVPAGSGISHAMSIDSLLNNNENLGSGERHIGADETDGHRGTSTPSELPRYTVTSIESERKLLRERLTEQCLNILNKHHDVTFELSELILSATKKLPDDDANDFRETASGLVINSLISLQTNDISQLDGSKVAAYSHLTALLLQDKEMYEACLGELQETFHDLLGFVKIPQASPNQESAPWVGHVLLIFEKMLSDDAEPRKIIWSPPASIDGDGALVAVPPPEKDDVLTPEQKKQLFDAVLAVLPQVGKDKSLALSAARVLVILTRKREIAVLLGEKRNIQRLFVMVKQLANAVDDRLQSALLLILRHVIEDEDTLRQIMRSEIVANFDSSRSSRQTDTNTYVRQMYHLVLRSPKIFIEVTNEKLKLQRYDPQRGPQLLVLKSEDEGNEEVRSVPTTIDATEPPNSAMPTTEVTAESDKLDANQDTKNRTTDIKPPVVEHPDGIIHFLLSELLLYKETEDKEISNGSNEQGGSGELDVDNTMDLGNGNVSDAASDFGATTGRPPGLNSRQPFKGEDHPIYIYRCFLLQCLTELLHSYNRTKIEFINFSRKADPLAMTPSKPRSGVLNYLLNGLIPIGSLEPDDSSVSFRKRTITSEWAMKVIVALCSKTGESGLIPTSQRYSTYQRVADNDDEPDLSFVRRFVLEHALRAFKDANNSSEALQVKYARILCLADLFHKLLSKPSGPEGTSGSLNNSHKTLSKLMFEKNFIAVLTSSLAEIDLAFPGSKRVVKHILKPLNELTETAYHLSVTSPSSITSALGTSEEDVISSASSVSDVDDEREETPDLFRNSTLAMLEPNRRNESSSESEGDDEEMYEDEYANDMEFEDDMPTVEPNDGEVVSEEDVYDDLQGARPMEGLSGDVPMDIELVLDDRHMDIDTDEEDEDEDEEDDEEDEDEEDEEENDDDDEEDGEDLAVGEDDAIMTGEINGDNENDSLDDGDEDREDEWQSEDDEENEMDDEDAEEVEEILDRADAVAPGNEADESGQQQLNNLLQILGEAPLDAGDGPTRPAAGLLVQASIDDDMPGHDDGDDEDGDELDENDEEDMNYQTFNDMLNDADTPWPWDEAPPFLRGHGGHHRHIRTVPGQMPSFITRQITSHGMPMIPTIARSHRHAVPTRTTDDGTNPLLQRPGVRPTATNAIPSPSDFVHSFNPGFTALLAPGSGHGGVIDAIMEAVTQGDRRFDVTNHRHGQYDIRINASPQQFRELLRPSHPSSFARSSREDPYRAVSFTPSLTVIRWQEEARLLFGNGYEQKSLYVIPALLSVLIPPAIEEEKARLRKAEEDRKREEEERAERERKERVEREEAEKKRKEEEAREAAAKAEAEAIATATAAAQASEASQSQEPPPDSTDDAEPMQDVQATGPGDATISESGTASVEAAGEARPAQSTTRVYTTIRGRQLDITDLAIDAEFLEGLPDDIREEVIMTQYAERRHQAAEQGQPSSEISAEFLDALPEDIREELLQQDAQDRRRREREAARRRAAEAGGPARAEDMDADSFMATLDPSLRRAILAEQSDDILQQLAPQYAAEARAIISRELHHYGRLPVGREPREDRDDHEPSSSEKEPRKQVVQMVDNAGVATLVRLMFMPQQGSARQNLYRVLQNVSGHRQTRYEVIRLLLHILKDGSADISAVERSLAQLSLRAKTPASQKTPQPQKQTLSLPSNTPGNDEMTPLMVVQQCLGALSALTQYNAHVAYVFLRELESSSSMKSKSSRKGKAKETRASKFALNDLFSLLDRKLITENSNCMESLAALLATVTQPLTWLLKKDKAIEPPKAQAAEAISSHAQPESTTAQPTSNVEVVEVEPVSPGVPSTETGTANLDTSSIPTGATAPASASNANNEATTSESDSKAADPEAGQEEDKAKKLLDPPEVPDYNLRLVVGILSAKECNAKTFRDAVTTITNLSLIPHARETFGKELVSQAQILSQSILSDLDELLPSILDAKSDTDIQNIATARFSPASSDQAKLLRVLTALDYIFDPKRPENKDKVESEGSTTSEILVSLYESPTFFPLWSKLSACLSAMRERDSMVSAATILLPLIESLMLVCKNTSLKDAPIGRHVREQSVPTPTKEGPNSLETLFFNFTTEHRKILNELVRQNSKLMSGSFSLLVKNPKVLEFDNKRSYFNRQVHARREARHPQPPLQLSVRRDQVFLDSFKSLYFKSADEMKYGKLSIRFHGEEGVDAGGVTREWFQVLARGMFNPNYALFTPVASDKTTFHPSRLSGVNQEHLMFFKFIGRIIGKALYENRVLDCHFSRAVYKRILGKPISIKDMESLDLDYYKSLQWILENDITDIITENFAIQSDDFGEDRIVDLIENGRNIPVTEENKQEYVQLVAEYRLTGSVKDQLENFLKGFNDIIPAELISIFNEQELELLISGLPDIDVDDWKANTEYHNYTLSSPQIQWFWRAVTGFSSEERAKLLQFVTGTSKTPLNGFADLEGMNGITKFNIHKDYGNKDRLPSSHTCFNQLDLPEYDSYEDLKQALTKAFEQGSDYFGFA